MDTVFICWAAFIVGAAATVVVLEAMAKKELEKFRLPDPPMATVKLAVPGSEPTVLRKPVDVARGLAAWWAFNGGIASVEVEP